jgi:FeS assembly SUF system regulator
MLRITKQADYGIVLLSRFAAAGPGAVLAARDLSASAGVPLPMVSKILKALTRHGLLASTRGVHGGYRLVRAPSEVSVAEVIAAFEGPLALTECLGHGTPGVPGPAEGVCAIEGTCPTRGHWSRINRAVREALEGLSLGDLVPQERRQEART